MPARKRVPPHVPVALLAAAGVAVVLLPYLPRGTDVYPHVLWSWQVVRCLAAADAPVWLPDLNAGFGSPGIRLYSPLGPLLSGGLSLVLGDSGRGIRAVLVLAAALLVLLAGWNRRPWAAALVLASPAIVFEALFRFPVSQLAALPLAWLLLDRALAQETRKWNGDGVLLALLWLVHAPTVALVLPLLLLLAARKPRSMPPFAGSLGLAATLTAWHWLPLWVESRTSDFAAALTAGELHPLRNLLGTPDAHLIDHNIALGWAAVAILAAIVVGDGWRSAPGLLATGCVFMASLASAPIWGGLGFLAWLQFPWRWLVPATLLAVMAIADAPRSRRIAAAVVLLAPLPVPPPFTLARDPKLAADTTWPEAGRRVFASFEGNPLLVDVDEHRPVWWNELGPTIAQLAGEQAALLPGTGGSVRPTGRRPTERSFQVTSPTPSRLVVRLLFDEHWEATIDGQDAVVERWGAATSLAVPPGSHAVRLRWTLDVASRAGALVSAFAALLLAAEWGLRRRRRVA